MGESPKDRQPGDQAFRRESLYGSESEQCYAGALSFLRRKYSRDLTGVDIAVTGVPLDLATTFRPGARFGPQAVRAGSVQLTSLKSFPFGFAVGPQPGHLQLGSCLDISYGN